MVGEPVKRFASLQIHNDPSGTWVLAFATLATLGLIAGMFVPRRRMWIKAHTTPAGVRVEYAGLARGEDPTLHKAVSDMANDHAAALTSTRTRQSNAARRGSSATSSTSDHSTEMRP